MKMIFKMLSFTIIALFLFFSCKEPPVDVNYFSLTIKTVGEGTVSISPASPDGKYAEGSEITVTATADKEKGYYFDGTTGDIYSDENKFSFTISEDMSITCNFTIETCAIYTYVDPSLLFGSVTTTPAGHEFDYGTEITLEAIPSSGGYYFYSWDDDVPTEKKYDNPITINLYSNKHITAYFTDTPVLHTGISSDSSGNGTITKSPDKTNYTVGETVELTATPDSNSVFIEWQEDIPAGHETDNPVSITMDSGKTVYAKFLTRYTLTLSTSGDGAGTISPVSGSYTYTDGEEVTITATPDSSSVLKQWTGDVPSGEENELSIDLTMDSDKTISAEFAQGYTLSITNSGDGSGSVSYSDVMYASGDVVTVTATANAGSTFSGWSGDHSSYNEEESFTFGSTDMVLDAGFKHNDWTIMVYLDADNNLESYGVNDINEMEASNLNGSGINLIVLADRIPGEYTGAGNWTDTRLYQVKYDEGGETNINIVSKRLSSTELGITSTGSTELNMGDPDTAIDFIDYCKAEHPADNYAFIIWNHGSGWRSTSIPTARNMNLVEPLSITLSSDYDFKKYSANTQNDFKAVAADDTSGDILFTQEVGTIFNGKGIDVIGFDLCLGAMIEAAYEIKDSANYMIASEENEPGDGWEYDDLFNTFKSTDLSQISFVNSVVDAFETRYTGQTGTTLSGIDLSEIDNVMTKLNSLSNALYTSITTSTIQSEIASLLYNNVEDYFSIPGDLNIDLSDAALQILNNTDYADTAATELITAIDNAVIAEWHDLGTTANVENTSSNGISIHYIALNDSGSPVGHNTAYVKDYSPAVQYPLSFVQNSSWVPCFDGTGLLYRLWYETID